MNKHLSHSLTAVGLALFSSAVMAMTVSDAQELVGKAGLYVMGLIIVITIAFVSFRKTPERRLAPLEKLLHETVQASPAVPADALVVDCVRMMAENRATALVVMDGTALIGIFTEWDALSKVLAAGRDPRATKIVEVMTTNPFCLSPETTVADAMEMVTTKHVRHVPVVENGNLLAVLSSRNLSDWLAKTRGRDIQDLIAFAN